MNPLEAIEIVEGYHEGKFPERQALEAWQCLVDTGLAWKLHGWYTRTVQSLIEAGLVKYRPKGGKQ